MVWWLAMAASAGIPTDAVIRPVAASRATIDRFTAWQAGRNTSASPPHCQALPIPEVFLCFRVWEGTRRRWVTEADRAQWAMTEAQLYEMARRDCVASLRSAGFRWVRDSSSAIGGRRDRARYLELVDGDGGAVAGVLCPEAVSQRLGKPTFRAAMPTEDVFLAWPAGDPELDRILAVGAREIHDQHRRSLTPQVVHFDGDRWRAFGRAVPSVP